MLWFFKDRGVAEVYTTCEGIELVRDIDELEKPLTASSGEGLTNR
jgi:hypothetical protein